MSVYFCIICIQTICMVILGGVLFYTYGKKALWRDPAFLAVLSAFVMAAGYFLFLQATQMGGLQAAQKVYLTGKILAPACLLMTYMSLLKTMPEKKRERYQILLWIVVISQNLFLWSDTLQRLVFTDRSFQQNQYFYFIEEKMTGIGYAGMIWNFCLLICCAVIACRRCSRLYSKILLTAVPVLPVLAEIVSMTSQARHYDFSTLAGTAAALFLIIALGDWEEQKPGESL